jgi:D-alanine-D-alanine ligase
MNRKKINVAVFVGGASSEREVSQMSCKGVIEALKALGYSYKLIDPALGKNQPENEDGYFETKKNISIRSSNYIDSVNSELLNNIDIVFNGLHGTWGEDGTLQSLLEMKGIPYTGSGVLASSISMNKTFTKVMFQHYNVATPKWILLKKHSYLIEELKNDIQNKLSYPVVVKPNNQGSAVGLSICKHEQEIEQAIVLAANYSEEILIEEYIDGHELTVGVLNGQVFPPLEIKPKHEFYDYTCKYTSGMSEYEVPAHFENEVLENLKEQAIYAFNSINGSCYGRVDFRLSKEHKTYCLEVNTLPGLTSTSLLPKTANAAGISFNELIDQIIQSSLSEKK